MINFIKQLFKYEPIKSIDIIIIESIGNFRKKDEYEINLWHHFIYEKEKLQEVLQMVKEGSSLESIKLNTKQNINVDNIQLYKVLKNKSQAFIVFVFDPYDYLKKEKVIEVVEI